MSTLQQRIAIITNLVAQLSELDRLRDRVRIAQLTARTRSQRMNRRKRAGTNPRLFPGASGRGEVRESRGGFDV
jgi:hypothetical protein